MKAILMSIKPKYAQLILGKTKTIEIRKRFPKDYVGWIYIYHTKAKNPNEWLIPAGAKRTKENDCSGKVVARFWCDKVEEINFGFGCFDLSICEKGCINYLELENYLKPEINDKNGYAIYITKLEIFDKPKEISEFENYNMVREVELNAGYYKGFDTSKITVVKKAPQSRFYVEVKE